jgi:hypothetical protein
MTTWTRELIADKLATSDEMVMRSLVVMLARQTSDEISDGVTKHNNGVGFSGVDAEFLTSLAKRVMVWNATPVGQRRYGKALSDKQIACARKALRKYVGQLLEVALEKVTTVQACEYCNEPNTPTHRCYGTEAEARDYQRVEDDHR